MTYATLFHITERDDSDRAVRLMLAGELDIASAPELQERLRELSASRRAVRLDLSQLDFMDSTGISTILVALQDAARSGWALEVDPVLPPQVARLITITGLNGQFWPSSTR